MKKIGLILLALALLGSFYFLRPYLGFNANALEVSVKSPIDLKKVKIYKGFNLLDGAKMNDLTKGHLIFAGKIVSKVETDYGENDFIVIYSDQYFCKFRHFKTNNKQRDTYKFEILMKGDSMFLKVDIDGTDPMVIDQSFQNLQIL